jgi:surface polysaccharide O-acyltransferase-like enzyme
MMATPTIGKKNGMVQIFRALAIIAVVMIHTTPAGYWQVFAGRSSTMQ